MGKAYFNVEDIYGNGHREVETIREMDNTLLVFDVDDHETYTIRKEDVGMKLNRPAIRREKFNLAQNKRIWRNRQKELKDIRYKYARKVYSGIEWN